MLPWIIATSGPGWGVLAEIASFVGDRGTIIYCDEAIKSRTTVN